MIARYPGRDMLTGRPIRPGDSIRRHGSGWTHAEMPRIATTPGECAGCERTARVRFERTDASGQRGLVCGRCNNLADDALHFD